MSVKHKNNATTTIPGAVGSTDTTIVVTDGTVFATLGGSDYFYATIESTSGNAEIVKVTAVGGNSLTVVRGQESTIGIPFAAGARIEQRVTAGNIGDYLIL